MRGIGEPPPPPPSRLALDHFPPWPTRTRHDHAERLRLQVQARTPARLQVHDAEAARGRGRVERCGNRSNEVWWAAAAACTGTHALTPHARATRTSTALDTADAATIEESIEEERKRLPATGLTPVTAESFARWKEARTKRKAEELESRRVDEAKKTGTKGYSALSGRALFTYDPSLFKDDDAADEHLDFEEDDAGEDGGHGDDGDDGAEEGDGDGGLRDDSGAAEGPIDSALYLEADVGDLDLADDDDDGRGR